MTRATQRGHDFEYRVARLVDGTVYAGQDGDVDVTGTPYRLECKYTLNLQNHRTKKWHDQIKEYEDRNPTKKFGLCYTGGKPYQNARVWVTIPLESFNEYTEWLRRQHALQILGMSENGNESTDSAL